MRRSLQGLLIPVPEADPLVVSDIADRVLRHRALLIARDEGL